MRADAARSGAGPELVRTRIVQQKEGAELLALPVIGKHSPDGKTVADPMLDCAAQHIDDFFQASTPSIAIAEPDMRVAALST
jgi:hypothetical protein